MSLADYMHRHKRRGAVRKMAAADPGHQYAHNNALGLWLRSAIIKHPELLERFTRFINAMHAHGQGHEAAGVESILNPMVHGPGHNIFPQLAAEGLQLPHVPVPDEQGNIRLPQSVQAGRGPRATLASLLHEYYARQALSGYHPNNLAYLFGQPGDQLGDTAAAQRALHHGLLPGSADSDSIRPLGEIDPHSLSYRIEHPGHVDEIHQLFHPALQHGRLGALAHILYLHSLHGVEQGETHDLRGLLTHNMAARDTHASVMREANKGRFGIEGAHDLPPSEQYYGH